MKKLLILLTLLSSCATIPERTKELTVCDTQTIKYTDECIEFNCSVITEEGYPATVEAETVKKGEKIIRFCFEQRFKRVE